MRKTKKPITNQQTTFEEQTLNMINHLIIIFNIVLNIHKRKEEEIKIYMIIKLMKMKNNYKTEDIIKIKKLCLMIVMININQK